MLTSRLIDGLRFANLSFASHRLMSSTFISPFQENEVYCSHHDDYSMRNGPVLMHGNVISASAKQILVHICFVYYKYLSVCR